MIKAVTFDFWNTLYVDDESTLSRRHDRRVALAQSFFASAGRDVESERVRVAIQATFEKGDRLQWDAQACLSHAEVGLGIAAELGFALEEGQAELLAELVSSAGRQYPPRPLDWSANLLERLKGRAKLGIISDTGLTFGQHLEEVMETHGLRRYFDHFTWSDRTLTTKPMARQFLYTLSMLGVAPAEAVHVGDLERRDVGGAKAAGMRCIRIVQSGDGRNSAADATVANLAGVPAVLQRWGLEL